MFELLTILTPIGLLDSTSMVPLCIVILMVLLAGPSPVFRSSALILGIFVVSFACGVLILLGLQSALDEIHTYLERLWKDPETEEVLIQIVLGAVLCAFGLRMTTGSKKRADKTVASGMTAFQALLAGGGLAIVGLPGAVPYFAAIDLTLREDLALAQQLFVLGYYNIVFVSPLIVIVVLGSALGERSQGALDGVKRFFDRWGQKVIAVLLVTLGAILIVDGFGWLFGHPLIPV
ncbi:MAG: hypothetical protein GY791_08130 [Alphaproteobacteria bacterium]|nr:hypothetical protein [Alphaproteobacteria bacterium]